MRVRFQRNGRDGEWAFIDTERGTITICDFQEMGCKRYERDFPGELWRGYPTYAVKTFFDHLKKKYLSLDLFPIDNHRIGQTSKSVAGGGDPYEADEPLRNIFRNHGWPTDDYQKDECIKKVRELYEQQKEADRKESQARMASWSYPVESEQIARNFGIVS
ncbi:hypothetical protein EJ08DRAFT_306560 [Tothia fuscella]|uniref:Uncharacterized protein n=1 Tax=Tothia fuscella TaxID=1048955 RepID=A0A9P4TXQ8_9PEZI|nr:hypothetical protein EJ08DRAFT_306560 [Tothia fuscella]